MRSVLYTFLLSTLVISSSAQSEVRQYVDQGRAHYKANEFTEAVALYDKALKHIPDWSVVYGYRSEAKRKHNDLEAYRLKASALSLLKRFDEAISQLDLALERNSKDSNAYFNRGVYNLQIEAPDINKGCEDFTLAKKHGVEKASEYLKRFCNK